MTLRERIETRTPEGGRRLSPKFRTWRIVYSPEGRTIAEGVRAQTARAAVRNGAPRAYRGRLGELYAEEV